MAEQPIFITGRFRAGTSFLWQLFNHQPAYCAWYEPLHPQLHSHVKHIKPKKDHVGIEDYWQSYREHPEYLQNFNPDFAHNGLWLEADSGYPELKQYIDDLIALSGPQRAVLQFNRMDFRLPWLKAHYPDAKIIHIKRKPMQLWHSQRKHLPDAERSNPSATDAYELMQWSVALSSRLPFLARRNHSHAFYRSYLLQKLSDLMGESRADMTLSLEADVFEGDGFANKLAEHIGGKAEDWKQARGDKHVPQPANLSLEEMSVLTDIMMAVDALLQESGLTEGVGKVTLNEIKKDHATFWDKQRTDAEWHNEEMLHALAQQQTELTEMMAVKTQLVEALAELKNNQTS